MKSVGIICGGYSSEYDISVASANTIVNNFPDGYEPYLIFLSKKGWEVEIEPGRRVELNPRDFSYNDGGALGKIDLVIVFIHGDPGENGKIQAYLEMIDMPYVNSGPLASQLSFDYRIEGIASEDYGEVIYSTDGGSSWLPLSGELSMSATWTSATYSLPAALNGTSFLLAYRFTYNNSAINGDPFAVDNVVVIGEDTTPPVMICDTPYDEPVDVNCNAFADDYTKYLIALSDNCTDSLDIILTQVVPEFTPFATGPGGSESITITATDEAGNSTQCVITINIVDDIVPTLVCPNDIPDSKSSVKSVAN